MESEIKKEHQEIDPKKLNSLKMLLYPESLEQYSKVTSILSDDFSFKIENLLNLKDIKKITENEETLIQMLKQISLEPNSFLTLNETKKEGKIIISERLMEYSFVNIPFMYNEAKVIELLKLKPEDYSRLYKQSLFWILISENSSFIENFEKFVKTLTIEGSPLKVNITSSQMLDNIIKKMIRNSTLKEANDLNVLNQRRKDSYSNSPKEKNEQMSWRKKSDNSDYSSDSRGYGFGNGGNYHSYGYGNKGFNGGNYKRRKRFQSDPSDFGNGRKFIEDTQGKFRNKFENAMALAQPPEPTITQDKVKYPLDVKYKYSNREIVDFYMKNKESFGFNENIFKVNIDDIMCKDNKKLIVAEKDNLSAEIPKNNPLLNFRGQK